MHTTKKIPLTDEYFALRLERLFEAGQPLMRINQEFDEYSIPQSKRYALILASPYGKDPKIRGAIEMFGVTE